jgi:hypothetical protein
LELTPLGDDQRGETATRTLAAIRRQIRLAFPAGIVSQPLDDPRSGDVVFHARQGLRRLRVIVRSEVLYDASARDVQMLLQRLVTLPDRLKALKSGSSLTIASDGFAT